MLKFSNVTKMALLVICAVGVVGASDASAKEWQFGLGSGFSGLDDQGDLGLNVGQFGPIVFDVDMDPGDFTDALDNAFGLAGYATDGTWMFTMGYKTFKLKDEPFGSLPPEVGPGSYAAVLTYRISRFEAAIGYAVYRSRNLKFSLSPYVGVRYLKHEPGAEVKITQGGETTSLSQKPEYNWTDMLVGASIGYVFSPKWNWIIAGDAGFGGSEGTYTFQTSLSWRVWKHISFGPTYRYASIDFENDERGDPDWFLYDTNESSPGISLMYHF